MMSVNNIIQLFENIATAHYQIAGFGFGNIFEIDGVIKPGLKYNLLWVIPVDSLTTEQTKQRRFQLIVVGLVKADLSNRDSVWSDCEQIWDDVVKILKNENEAYELIGEPVATPVSEKFGDWVTGWQGEVVIQTDLNSNYCDIPADGFNSPVIVPGYGVIKNRETGEIVKTLKKGEEYYITILDTIEQSLGSVTPTIIQVLG